MQPEIPKFAHVTDAGRLVAQLGDDFAVVKNPPYVFPAYDVYVLAAPHRQLDEGLTAAVMDMDGTTTTTEVLCTGALEAMVQRLSGMEEATGISTLNHERDYPHIIGNSTTRHVEYLVATYGEGFVLEAMCRSFIEACAWNIACALDPKRGEEAATALRVQGLDTLLADPLFKKLCDAMAENSDAALTLSDRLTTAYKGRLRAQSVADRTRIGIEVYYQRYHQSLRNIENGTFPCTPEQPRPIAPMPGIGIALALLKGWLGKDAACLGESLAAYLHDQDSQAVAAGIARLSSLGEHFAAHPVKLGLVTSSIAAEATIVLREVFRVIHEEINDWPLSREKRDFLRSKFEDPAHVYDACITASDSSEIRLKPHRDLYAIALHTLGIPPEQFHRVAGFEDSESGTIAIRAAGISLCCALPFAMTHNHRFEAATQVCHDGIPEVILIKNFFLGTS